MGLVGRRLDVGATALDWNPQLGGALDYRLTSESVAAPESSSMSPLLLVRLGAVSEGGELYALLDGSLAVARFTASKPDEAFRRAETITKGRELVAEPALADEAAAHGLSTRGLTLQETLARAEMAVATHVPEAVAGIRGAGVALVFFQMACVLQDAAVADTRQWLVWIEIAGLVGTTPVKERTGLILETGRQPLLVVLGEHNFQLVLDGKQDWAHCDRTEVRFVPMDAELSALLRPAYGFSMFPRATIVRGNARSPIDDLAAEKLAGLMAILASQLTAGVISQDWSPKLGGKLSYQLTVEGVAE